MKAWALAGLLIAGGTSFAGATVVKQFELNGENMLTIVVPLSLQVRLAPAEGGQPANLMLSDTNHLSQLHMVLARSTATLSDEQIKTQLLEAGKKLMSAVVEKEIKVRKLGGKAFTYFYFELTDSRLDQRQGSRYIVQGLGRASGYVCEFVMTTNQKSADAQAQILNSLRSIDIRPKK